MGTVEKGKESGERVIAPTRRPDGSLRKEIRIRAGYTPQDEVAIYLSKAALSRKGTDVPPGYDPEAAVKPKSKAAKQNEKRKEKKQALRATSSAATDPPGGDVEALDVSLGSIASNDADHVAEQLDSLKLVSSAAPVESQQEEVKPEGASGKVDLEKRIRAIKKKIRLAESKQQSTSAGAQSVEQAERLAKLETWRRELQDLEALLASAIV